VLRAADEVLVACRLGIPVLLGDGRRSSDDQRDSSSGDCADHA
jgi:hypothetical protein